MGQWIMSVMRILGIDPGLERVGFGLLEVQADGSTKALDWGMIKTCKTQTTIERITDIHAAMHELCKQFKPDKAVVERLFFFRNITTMGPVSEARGVILLALQQNQINIEERTPLEVKMTMTGYGKSDKKEIQEMVKLQLGLDKLPKPDDAADALALALCCSVFQQPKSRRTSKAAKKVVVLESATAELATLA